jgi:UDP-glucose 4-epimerase
MFFAPSTMVSTPLNEVPCALVTGAAGFLGAHVTATLAQMQNLKIVALDDLSGGFEENLIGGIEFIRGSVTDHTLLARLFERYRFHYVYHLAAYAAEGLSHFIRRFNYTNNLIGTVNLINEAVKAGTRCFVFTSSIAVYGSIEPPMREDKLPRPEDPYGIAKWAAELDLQAAHEMFGLNYIIFRPHNVYGEWQNLADPYRNVVGIFIKQIMQGEPMTIFGDGEQTRAFSYVADVAPVIARAPFIPAAQNETFNIGADEPYTVKSLARHVAEAMGSPNHPIVHLPARNEVQQVYADHSKARLTFDLHRPAPLPEGLARMAAWAKKIRLQPLQAFADIEVEKNMPPSWLKYQLQTA